MAVASTTTWNVPNSRKNRKIPSTSWHANRFRASTFRFRPSSTTTQMLILFLWRSTPTYFMGMLLLWKPGGENLSSGLPRTLRTPHKSARPLLFHSFTLLASLEQALASPRAWVHVNAAVGRVRGRPRHERDIARHGTDEPGAAVDEEVAD